MASLFDLSLEFYALKDLMENDFEVDEETGEFIDNTETINNLFNGLKMTFEDKLDNSQRYILTLNGEADILAKEIKRLQAKKTALENKADRLYEMMKNAILSSGENKFKTSLYSFNIKKTESVEVRDLDVIPRAYLRLKKEADKVAIKKALKNGDVIEGVYLSEKLSLGVK
jgi:seryl-tRNA synthetase